MKHIRKLKDILVSNALSIKHTGTESVAETEQEM